LLPTRKNRSGSYLTYGLVITLVGKEESRLNKKEIAQNDMKLDIN
jgi:hypothetical protein